MTRIEEMTNSEFIMHMMEFSKAGPLSQIFIIEAITQYSQNVIDNADELQENSFIDATAWLNTAKIITEEMAARYGNL
jgi:hypothetical protein